MYDWAKVQGRRRPSVDVRAPADNVYRIPELMCGVGAMINARKSVTNCRIIRLFQRRTEQPLENLLPERNASEPEPKNNSCTKKSDSGDAASADARHQGRRRRRRWALSGSISYYLRVRFVGIDVCGEGVR